MQHFNVRFPDAKGLYVFSMQEGDISLIFEEPKKLLRAESKNCRLRHYQRFPLAVIQEWLERSRPDSLDTFGSRSRHSYMSRLARGARVERSALAARASSIGAVLDFYTVWIASTFKLLPVLKAVFGRLIVPRSAIDAFLRLESDASNLLLRGELVRVGYHDGHFTKQITSEEDMAKTKKVSRGTSARS